MSNIKFRMAARCEAAGRPNNEDNYQLDFDLSDDIWGFTADKPIDLGKKGALLVVCDGMGGMNAGEVASAIAVATIKSWFDSDKLTTEVLASPKAYIKQAIIAADSAIKAHGKAHPETEGMGSTIVMAWMLGKKVYVGWCGDSRCYCYNPQTGLVRLSRDHSYVQELVDAGKLTEDLAFDHPNNNVITRSLGDPNGTARPDVKEFDLHDEDILLLCSDGLCGCLRDKEIEKQIATHYQGSMQECRDALWAADEAAGWHDNVTIALAQVISGGQTVQKQPITSASNQLNAIKTTNKRLKIGIAVLILLIVCIAVGIAYKPIVNHWQTRTNPTDSAAVATEPSLMEPEVGQKESKSKEKKKSMDVNVPSVKGDEIEVEVVQTVPQTDTINISEIMNRLHPLDSEEVNNDATQPNSSDAQESVDNTQISAPSTGSADKEQTKSKEEADEAPAEGGGLQEKKEDNQASQLPKGILDKKQGDAISSPDK
ncbi:MAG: PP2C family protein-serine/threonine phosphatase [Paludibacteraceae bacterium]